MTINLAVTVRVWRGAEVAIGPGKADLLDAIGQAGSISAAARQMNMSYRRAWLLVDLMNRSFREPLVRSAIGGSRGGGAQLTAAGLQVLAWFRAMEAAAGAAAEQHMEQLAAQMLPPDGP